MSGYFVHGGTQYPGVSGNQSNQSYDQSNSYGLYEAETKPSTAFDYGSGMTAARTVSTQGFTGQTTQINNMLNPEYMATIKSENTGSYSGYSGSSSYGNYSSQNSFQKKPAGGNSGTGLFGGLYGKPTQPSSGFNSYEKALHAAANQYYSNKRGGLGSSGTPRRGGGGRGRGRGGGMGSQQASGPKPIKATEIKAYLYAWCGQRRLKPEYEIETVGSIPKIEFSCTLKVSSLDYVAKVQASSKKEAQTKAAWDYAENLIKQGYMKASELPEKPVDVSPKLNPPQPSVPAGVKVEEANTMENTGGWTLENCRQRLNQFCQRERIPAEFKHETMGPEHARTFTAEFSCKVPWLENREFNAKETGKNKKQATALCALSIVRQLFKADVIEKQGDPIKIQGKVISKEEKMDTKEDGKKLAGTKRKATDSNVEIDEKGNWTLENSKQRLHLFCKAKDQPFKIDLEEKILQPNKKVYVASMQLAVTVNGEEKKLDSSQTSNSKKTATQEVALDLVKQLYELKLVEAYTPTEKKRNQRRSIDNAMMAFHDQGPFGMNMFSAFPMPMAYFPKRLSGITEIIVAEKHNRIFPEDAQLMFIQEAVVCVEKGLKNTADALAAANVKQEEGKPDQPKSLLQGVMRVGKLAKGLLLKDEYDVELVLLCTRKPTVDFLNNVMALLGKSLQDDETAKEKYILVLKPDVQNACVIVDVTSKEDQTVMKLKIFLTCTQLRSPLADNDPDQMLNREMCLKALAELRHAKWFQACAVGLPSCLVTLRLLLDIKKRNPTWQCISDWALELMVEKSLVTSFGPLSEGDALRRVFSCLSSGILLPGGPGLQDPCEKEEVDVFDSMTQEEKEELTESAQHAMRMIVYRQAYKVLGIEPPPKRDSLNTSIKSENGAAMEN